MKYLTIFPLLASLFLLLPTTIIAVEAPSEIAGFRLGEDITEYPDIEYSNYLKEVIITDWYGFRKGIISYGLCVHPGEIVKIALKYEDSSKAFFKKLMKEFKKKYGKPTEWKGDAFGIMHVWKWVFIDENNRRVNLLLQHNLQNHNENIGNVVKLSYPERAEEERLCFIQQCAINKTEGDKKRLAERKEPNWEYMIPR